MYLSLFRFSANGRTVKFQNNVLKQMKTHTESEQQQPINQSTYQSSTQHYKTKQMTKNV